MCRKLSIDRVVVRVTFETSIATIITFSIPHIMKSATQINSNNPQQNAITGLDLVGAKITGLDLIGAKITGLDLIGAKITGLDLIGA